MKKLGISIYPNHSEIEKDKKYIKLAHKYGYKRIFTCLLSVEGNKEKIIQDFKEVIKYANELEMEVMVDINPRVFSELEISYKDLSFFADLEVFGLRLDMGFSGNEESLMTFNPYNMKIEVNMSNDTRYIDTIMNYHPNKRNLLGCHNFYPHRFTGLSRLFFRQTTNNFKKYNLKTSAFVTAQTGTFGPWPVTDGLCTLEEHRNLPIEIQGRDLFLEEIDCVIISNCYADEEELKRLSEVNQDILELEVVLENNLDEIQKKIVLEELHFNRGDINDYLIRSTQSRVKYKGHNFPLINERDIKRGDIIIESSLYGHYAGELQVAKKDMINSKRSSIVGRVDKKSLFFLDRIKPWQKFKFINL